MNLNSTPSGERPHIVFLGCRNAGKSSLINAVTGQKLAIVSDVRGTTTDPVYKAMELLPAGPVMIVDTPGLDDEGYLGQLRIEKAYEALRKADLAVLVVDGSVGITESDRKILDKIRERKLNYIIVLNKADIVPEAADIEDLIRDAGSKEIKADEVRDADSKEIKSDEVRDADNKEIKEDETRDAGSKEIKADETRDADNKEIKEDEIRDAGEIGDAHSREIKEDEIRDADDKINNDVHMNRIMKVSALTGEGIHELKEYIAELLKGTSPSGHLVSDLVETEDLVLLVIPIDKAAPKGRLILPQQQVIRDLLDKGAIPMEVRTSELANVLDRFGDQIRMVITDSQAFREVSKMVPESILLTSFSILFSRYKGELEIQKQGVDAIVGLKDGDRVLIAEGCTHHRQCGDIGRDKIPTIVRKLCGHEPEFIWTSGTEFPSDLTGIKAVIHCGGCMLNEQEMKARIGVAVNSGVPITNYGMVIAAATGVLERSLKIFSE